ncbi:MAG: right-handed parallel beta-helix repeat-containing protein [Bacteroidota bacterium]
MRILKLSLVLFICTLSANLLAKEYHVSKNGDDKNPGTEAQPFKTISKAAEILVAGDTVTVHKGVYRESVSPVNEGKSDIQRILYRAADGENVVIKGSEIVSNWKLVEGNVWKAVVPNAVFGNYNPFSDYIAGDWFIKKEMKHHTGEVYINGRSLYEQDSLYKVVTPKEYPDSRNKKESLYTWYSEVDGDNTTIWANFQGENPNKNTIEINVRPTCFYPEKPGVDFITVRGFVMDMAATQWAAPTAEQVGLIGTHWSKGWIIENNTVSNSKCVGITLGKDRSTGHNVASANRRKDGATHYNEVIFRALEIGWNKDNIGSHIVRNNDISNCEQAGIVGSLGAVFSEISNNHIHDIWKKRAFFGFEIAGIKIHGAIDMLIADNHIHNAGHGVWIDWMAQGTRISRNLFYDNTMDDLFSEVNHGPYLVDNNVMLSDIAINEWSEGAAFVHNLIAGQTHINKVGGRFTPYNLPHSTKVAGLRDSQLGDNRYYNNIFINTEKREEKLENSKGWFYGLNGYDIAKFENAAEGNIHYNGSKTYKSESNFIELPDQKPEINLLEEKDGMYLEIKLDKLPKNYKTSLVTTETLGATITSEALYEDPDGSPIVINNDIQKNQIKKNSPIPGPFAKLRKGKNKFKLTNR